MARYFSHSGFPEVKTARDFLYNVKAQHKVYEIDEKRKDFEIKRYDLEKYIGTKIDGIPITRSGIHNMIHLKGVGVTVEKAKRYPKSAGARTFLDSNGAVVGVDGNRTKISEYARIGADAESAAAGSPSENENAQENNESVPSPDQVFRLEEEALKKLRARFPYLVIERGTDGSFQIRNLAEERPFRGTGLDSMLPPKRS